MTTTFLNEQELERPFYLEDEIELFLTSLTPLPRAEGLPLEVDFDNEGGDDLRKGSFLSAEASESLS